MNPTALETDTYCVFKGKRNRLAGSAVKEKKPVKGKIKEEK